MPANEVKRNRDINRGRDFKCHSQPFRNPCEIYTRFRVGRSLTTNALPLSFHSALSLSSPPLPFFHSFSPLTRSFHYKGILSILLDLFCTLCFTFPDRCFFLSFITWRCRCPFIFFHNCFQPIYYFSTIFTSFGIFYFCNDDQKNYEYLDR